MLRSDNETKIKLKRKDVIQKRNKLKKTFKIRQKILDPQTHLNIKVRQHTYEKVSSFNIKVDNQKKINKRK